ncbi:hypothetical protein C8Q79DRAFT_909951 [Trametes meyenii]|nr:hypothetical protein C8Q79DRAFT_909951 [Trametes meyenii]
MEVLNWDVLLDIMTFLPRQDLSRLMRACRAFHTAGLKQLLSYPIEIRADNLISLHTCVVSGETQRALLLRELTINCSLSRPRQMFCYSPTRAHCNSTDRLLADILREARHLRKLDLDWAAAGLSSYLRDAASALVDLQELRVPFVSQALWDDLGGMHAPLRRLSMQLGPMSNAPVTDPIPLLERFRSTLEDVRISGVHFEDASTTYPSVRKLSLSDCYCDFQLGGINIAPVTEAFPRLTEFAFSAAKVHPEVSQWSEGRNCDKPELVESCRRSNKHWNTCDERWKSLRRVTVGHIIDLYMLGLEGHVAHLEVHMLSEATIPMLHTVLRDTHPASLSLSLFVTDRVIDCISALLNPGASTDGLAHLMLTLRCTKPVVNVDRIVTAVSRLLWPLRVEHLTIYLHRWDTVGMYYLPEEHLRPIDRCLERVWDQANGIAGRFFQDVLSLQRVTIRVGTRETICTREPTNMGIVMGRHGS